MANRKIIVHYHLFKNAGTSVDRMLQKSFGDQWINYDLPAAGARISPENLAQYIAENPHLQAISSHQIVPPLPEDGIDVFPIVFLRDPIDRVKSAYLFEWQKQPALEEPKGSFSEYVREKLGAYRRNAIEEFQVIKFANKGQASHTPNMKLSDGQLLANSRDFIASLNCFGIVEKFNESMALFESKLPEGFPKVTFERSVRANSLQDPGLSLDDKYNKIQEELGDELYTELVMRNQMDIKLYQYALGKFDQNLSDI